MAKQNRKNIFDADKMLLSNKSPFTVEEAYKTLRTNVTFSLPGKDSKCIGIVSSDRREGKSSVAVNLAISFAQINKKVVLIDCDMRLPTIASKLNLPSQPGLSNFLIGSIDSIPILRSKKHGIDIIVSGNIPPDTTTLIESDFMVQLITALKEDYDYLVFDFPPLTIVSDAAILSSQIDGYLFVVRHRLSEYNRINEALRQVRLAKARVIGFVYNGKGSTQKYYKTRGKYYKGYYDKGYYKQT